MDNKDSKVLSSISEDALAEAQDKATTYRFGPKGYFTPSAPGEGIADKLGAAMRHLPGPKAWAIAIAAVFAAMFLAAFVPYLVLYVTGSFVEGNHCIYAPFVAFDNFLTSLGFHPTETCVEAYRLSDGP